MPGGKTLRDGVLRAVRVLVLVDEYVGEALLIGPRDIRKALQQKPGVVEQIVEIHSVGAYEALLVHGEDPRRHGVLEALVRRGRKVGSTSQLVFRLRDAVGESLRRKALGVEVQLGGDVFHQALRVVGVVYGELARVPYLVGVLAQDAHAHAVEGAHPHPAHGPCQSGKTRAHLLGCLVGEGDGQNLPGLHAAIAHEMRDAVGEDARLARTRAGQHEQRPVHALHRAALRVVEACQVDAAHAFTSFITSSKVA